MNVYTASVNNGARMAHPPPQQGAAIAGDDGANRMTSDQLPPYPDIHNEMDVQAQLQMTSMPHTP